MMTAKAMEARRAYKRKWAKDNPDKVRMHQERYWAKRAEQMEAEESADPQEASLSEAEN